jgi:hypothetical protein
MKELKLKTFIHADFRKSEETLFNEFLKTDYGASIKNGEHVMFISMSDNLYQFVEAPDEFDTINRRGQKVRVKVLASQRFRIRGGKWDPLMLSVYAERAGYRITGIKRFEWYLKERVLELKKAA